MSRLEKEKRWGLLWRGDRKEGTLERVAKTGRFEKASRARASKKW